MNWKKIKKRWVFLALFLISTAFFIYQHYTMISWDFSVYVMNSQYIFNKGYYFEWYRSPLMPSLLFLFSFGGYLFSEYLYIIFVSGLFAFSCMKFSEKVGFDVDIFYALMLSPFVLNAGLSIGTEILTLSLLMLFITYLHERKSSLFLGLAFLSRYTTFIFLPIIFFKRNWKEILIGLFLVGLVFSPWSIYNYSEKGHPFYSMASSSALNVVFRDYYTMPPNLVDFIVPMSFYFLIFVPGIYLAWKSKFKEMDWVMVIFFLLMIFSYLTVPHKEPRYLFNLILPSAYFAYGLINRAIKKFNKNYVLLFIILLNFVTATIFFYSPQLPTSIYDSISEADDGCMVMSNMWPYVNYFGLRSEPFPAKENLGYEVQKGKRILLFKSVPEPPYVSNHTFLEKFPIIRETNSYLIIGNESLCAPVTDVDKSYLEGLEERGVEFHLHPILPIVKK